LLPIAAWLALGLAPPAAPADEPPAPPGPSVRDPEVVAILGAISAERVRARIEKLAGFGTRHTLSDTKSDDRGIGAARRWIKAEMDRIAEGSGGRMTVELDSYVQEPRSRVAVPTEVVNVVATIKGRRPDRYLVVGGHYDSMRSDVNDPEGDAPGANDDASGTAVVLELAEAMASHDFDANVVLVAFAGEEQGLLGSTHLAGAYADAGRNVEAMLTNDIVGNTEGSGGARDNRTLRVFSEGLPALDSPLAARLRSVSGENDSPSRQLARYLDEAADQYLDGFDVRLVFRADRYLRGGDHAPFLARGFPAVRLTEPVENFARQHQDVRQEGGIAYGDVPEKVDFAYVADVARVNAAAIASLALAPPAPADATIVATRLENDTTLQWSPVEADDLAGYEVVWRDTTAPTWERARFVGDATRVTLPGVSKDNLQFGVRSVDRRGHRSLVSFPLPRPRRPAGGARSAGLESP
jgi:acetylornithine deacetylase/succinyl-diaminopimelate desuccinylase-like protein